jgi:hypothetical protein
MTSATFKTPGNSEIYDSSEFKTTGNSGKTSSDWENKENHFDKSSNAEFQVEIFLEPTRTAAPPSCSREHSTR